MHRLSSLLRDEQGSVTVEAAFGIASMVSVAALIVGAIATLAAHVAATDIAGAAARSHAVGRAYEPPKGHLVVTESQGWVEVESVVPAVFGSARATARFPIEYHG